MPDLTTAQCAELQRAVSDPGSVLPRDFDSGDGRSVHEAISQWQMRAVEKLIGPWLAGPGAEAVAQFQVHCDEDGDLGLACPRVDDLGCLFAAGFTSGSTLGQLAGAASKHTGEVAERAHDFLRRVNGDA